MKKCAATGLVLILVLGSGCSGKHTGTTTQTGGSGNGLGATQYDIHVINNSTDFQNFDIYQYPQDGGNGLLGATSYKLNVINNSAPFENFVVYQRDPDLTASLNAQSKDVDLQRAQLQQAQIEDRAQTLASEFGMNVEAARSLTLISDKMSQLDSQGNGITDEDRGALAGAALEVAGIQAEETNTAIASMIQTGDRGAVDALVARAADESRDVESGRASRADSAESWDCAGEVI